MTFGLVRRMAVLCALFCAILLPWGCRLPGDRGLDTCCRTEPETAWRHRSQWEVIRDGDGLYRASHVREARPDRLVVTVSTTEQAHDWKRWLIHGSSGAVERVTYVIRMPAGDVLRRYDHLTEAAAPGTGWVSPLDRRGRSVTSGDGVFAPGRLLIEELAVMPGVWSGFYANPVPVAADGCAATNGLAVYAVGAASCVDLAGMQPGDILIRLWPWDYNDPVFVSYLAVGRAVRDRFQPGDPVRLEYLRPREGGHDWVRKEFVWPGLPYLDRQPGAAMLNLEAQFLARAESPERTLLDVMADQAGVAGENADLFSRLGRRQAWTDAFRLPAAAVAHKHPFLMEPIARRVLDCVPPPGPQRIAAQVRRLYEIYGLEPDAAADDREVREYRGGDLESHVDHIEDLLALAAHHHRRAFGAFSAEELQFMETASHGLMEGFVSSHMMCFDRDLERQRRNVELLGMAARLDIGALLRQAETAARIVDGAFLDSLKVRMESHPNPAGRIAERDTPWGRIVLDGTADKRYIGGEAAVLINLGGDNYYANNTGSSVPGKLPSAVLVDFAGNDRYENWAPMRQGCGFMGVGILVDIEGDDRYLGARYVQGAGFMGVGILADLAGDDEYRAMDHGQGVGQFGAGLLLDDSGHNVYEGRQVCQGVGFTAGVGLLYSADEDGNDRYFNKGVQASSYRDAGSFEGWGQGLGVGHRPYASGGLGILFDAGGDDRFEGGAFSMGGGYFFGMGILNNRAGHDRYSGSRYGMGFTAHQAVGVFLDDAGDDVYETSHFVAMGMAWDESCTLFVDRSGDDLYTAHGFAFGAAAMNGFALFIEGGGTDRFVGVKPGAVHGNSYHGGSSIAYFLGLGDGSNTYPHRVSGEISVDGDNAFFVDSPSIDAALDRLHRQPLGTGG